MAYVALPCTNESGQGKGENMALLERPQLCAPSISVPRQTQMFRPFDGRWSTDMCGCCDPPGGCRLCLFSYVMPHWTMGMLVERMEPERVLCGGSFWGGCCLSWWLCFATAATTLGPLVPFYLPLNLHVHRAIARKYGIRSNAACDCLSAWLCPCLLICQDVREIMIRENAEIGPLGTAWPSPPAYT